MYPRRVLGGLAGLMLGLAAGSANAFFQFVDSDNESEDKAAAAAAPGSSANSDTSEAATGLLTGPVPEVKGPKRVLSVGQFTSTGAFNAKYGNWDIGGGLAAMLTTALQESGRFIVVERAQLQSVLSEQEMAANRVTSGTGPEVGKLLGVQFIIIGAVTEFGADDSGGGFSLGIGGGGIGGFGLGGNDDVSAGVSRQSISGTVAMDVRVVDTTTGRIIQAFPVKEKIDNSSWDLSVGYQMVNVGTNSFVKTPLGQAARGVINQAVQKIALTANENAWQGRVVDFDAGEVYINAGSNAGVKQGDSFTIERVTKRLTDPETNEVLMVKKKELGLVQVEQVLPKISLGGFQALDVDQPQRGDIAVMIEN